MQTNTPSVSAGTIPQGIVRTSRFITLNLAAGEVQHVPQAGTRFYIVSQDKTQIDIGIKTENTVEEMFRKGTGKAFSLDQFFQSLEVRNTSATLAVKLIIFAGFGDFIDNRLNVVSVDEGLYLPIMEGRTRFAAWTGVSLDAAGGAVDHLDLDGVTPVAAAPVGLTDVKRQSIVVTNNDAVNFLDLVDAAGSLAGRIFPEKQVMLPISEFIRIKNNGGAAVSCAIAEIWTCIKA